MKYKDKFGRFWFLPKRELCKICGQPDNCGDCNHLKLTKENIEILRDYSPTELFEDKI